MAMHLLDGVEARPKSDPRQVEHAWLNEANRRYEAYLRGKEQIVPAEEVFSDLGADDR